MTYPTGSTRNMMRYQWGPSTGYTGSVFRLNGVLQQATPGALPSYTGSFHRLQATDHPRVSFCATPTGDGAPLPPLVLLKLCVGIDKILVITS